MSKQDNTIEVIPVGTTVELSNGAISGLVTGISIRENNSVSYEVAWFIGNDRKTGYFYDFEMIVCHMGQKPVQTIGFKTINSNVA